MKNIRSRKFKCTDKPTCPGNLVAGHFVGSGMMDFIRCKAPNLFRRKFDERNRIAIIRRKFNHVSATAIKNMHDRPHVIHRKAVFGEINVQRNAIEFSDHQLKDTR